MTPLAPGAKIGILGGGQLGRMIALAAARLGFGVHVFAPDETPPAAIAAKHYRASYQDEAALKRFAEGVDLITYEMEHLPTDSLRDLAESALFRPSLRSLETARHRLREKEFLSALGIPTAPFFALGAGRLDAGRDIPRSFRFPAIVKRCLGGYDGRGQRVARDRGEIVGALSDLGGGEALIEERVSFRREISVLAARGADGDFRAYDVVENCHRDGILRESRVPARIGLAVAARAKRWTKRIAEALDHIGVLGVEFFLCDGDGEGDGEGALFVNEIAPRVHNSGHWTMDACAVGQFEQHLRAIAGWPLAEPVRFADVRMVNLLGDDVESWRDFAARRGVCLHLYGKQPARAGRKMGHMTALYPLSSGGSGGSGGSLGGRGG